MTYTSVLNYIACLVWAKETSTRYHPVFSFRRFVVVIGSPVALLFGAV
jgi:hypothetical protein